MATEHGLAQLPPEKTDGLLASYVIGFVFSIGLTLLAYAGVTRHWFAHGSLMAVLLLLALLQLFVQLIFFLHIGREVRPRWKMFTLLLSIMVVLIVVIGSIWIMYNLNYRMGPEQMERYLQQQDGGI